MALILIVLIFLYAYSVRKIYEILSETDALFVIIEALEKYNFKEEDIQKIIPMAAIIGYIVSPVIIMADWTFRFYDYLKNRLH